MPSAPRQLVLDLFQAPPASTARERGGWCFQLTPREAMLLRKPITDTPGGWQSAMREAATRIYPDLTWHVSDQLLRRFFRMCTRQGPHGGYQTRLPMRVLSSVFESQRDAWAGTWFYGKREEGHEERVKLGKTDNPPRRLTPYSTDNPRRLITLFQIWDAAGDYESLVKLHFAACRQTSGSTEWYRCTPEVLRFVALCCRVTTTAELPPLEHA